MVSLAADVAVTSVRPFLRRPLPAAWPPSPACCVPSLLSPPCRVCETTVAVPEAAQAVVAAAMAAFSERTPLLVVTATGLDAQRLADDLACLIAPEDDGGDGTVAGAVAGPVASVAGLGDAPVPARQPGDRDNGAPPRCAPRTDRGPGPVAARTAQGDRRPGAPPSSSGSGPEGDGTDRHPTRAAG